MICKSTWILSPSENPSDEGNWNRVNIFQGFSVLVYVPVTPVTVSPSLVTVYTGPETL